MVTQVSRLRCKERMSLDTTRLSVLYVELGQVDAERVICATVEDLAVQLAALEEAAKSRQRAKMQCAIVKVIDLSEHVGLVSMVRTARDLSECIATGDAVAQAAVMARLGRIAERSLTEVWDIGDLSS